MARSYTRSCQDLAGILSRLSTWDGKYLLIYDSAPPPPLLNMHCRPFSFKCTTALWTGKENMIWTRGPIGPWGTLTKYKCLAPTQNSLAKALVEKVEGRLNNFSFFMMTFVNICTCEFLCIVVFIQ